MSEDTDTTTPRPALFEFDFDRTTLGPRDTLRELMNVLYARIGEGPREHDPLLQALLVNVDELNDAAVSIRLTTLEERIADMLQSWLGMWEGLDSTTADNFRELFDEVTDRYRLDLVGVLRKNPELQLGVDPSYTWRNNVNYDEAALPFVTPSGRDFALTLLGTKRGFSLSGFEIYPSEDTVKPGEHWRTALTLHLYLDEPGAEGQWFIHEVNQQFADLLGTPGVGIYATHWSLPEEQELDGHTPHIVTDDDLAKIFALLDRPPQQT